MNYNLENVNKRFDTGSKKWNELLEYGITNDEDIVPFSVADMEFETAPEIKEALIEKINSSVLGYENPTSDYLNEVCKWQKKHHNWDAKPEWILPSSGVIDAFNTAIQTYTNEGDGIILMTPVYYPMYIAIDNNGRKLLDNKLIYKDWKYEIDFDDFEKKASDENAKLLILCSPHNPSGRVWTHDELKKISEICLKNNVLVVSDEIHNDIVMPGYEHIVYASLSEEALQNSIICTAPSKTFNLAGLQTSNIFIANNDLRQKFKDTLMKSNPNPKCNLLGYTACKAAYENCEEWLEEVLSTINTNKKLVVDFLKKEFPEIIVTELEATYLLWMNFRALNIDYKELERINKEEAKLFFDEGYIFGDQGQGFERWNLACPTKYIEEGLIRLKKVYSKYKN